VQLKVNEAIKEEQKSGTCIEPHQLVVSQYLLNVEA